MRSPRRSEWAAEGGFWREFHRAANVADAPLGGSLLAVQLQASDLAGGGGFGLGALMSGVVGGAPTGAEQLAPALAPPVRLALGPVAVG